MATKKKQTKTTVVWYARGGGLSLAGPYKTQIEAVKAMLLAGSTMEYPRFPDDVFVWPVEKDLYGH